MESIHRRPEVEKQTGLSRSTIYQQMSEGTFPKPIRIGKRAVGWTGSSISAWLADRAKINAN
ncbi:helix-turn-helix transcriptional regulator [Falsihalocynthiibacter sp. CO-5D18]|uniref:helix-turn-helix transcriptional regulator n=1 Tax=Falsihalocynthiibacter sp. CO-5D18 TaxID=3240872 RepID=UPI0035100E75